MKEVIVQLQGTTAVDVICDCGEPITFLNNRYYCFNCNEEVYLHIIDEEAAIRVLGPFGQAVRVR